MTAPDQLLLYDSTLAKWIAATFGILLQPDKNVELLVGTPDRAFSEYVSHLSAQPYGMLPVPRMALTLGDPERFATLFNPSTIRKLGYSDTTKTGIRQAVYPVSVKIPYTLNIWTEYRREMNLFVQSILREFRYGYTYIPVDFDSITTTPIYGTKDVGLFPVGALADSGGLEPPGSEERIIRRTLSFDLHGWLWDYDFQTKYVLKEIEFQIYRDRSMTQLMEIVRTPQRETITTANGTDHTYSGVLTRLPVIQQTFIIDATVSGLNVRGIDNGSNTITGTGITGTINYTSGAYSVTYTGIPDNATPIEAAYYTEL